MKSATNFALALLSAFVSAETDVNFESMGHFSVNNAAFLSVSQFDGGEPFLLVSSFTGSPLGSGHVYVVPGVTDAIVNNTVSSLKQHKLKVDSFEWPNDVAVIPKDVFGEGINAIVVPDGFLVPGKSNGGIYVITVDPTDVTKALHRYTITHNKDGYFYHMGNWIDMNGDGRKDFVTAKSNAKAGEGRLVWYEHPAEGLGGTWTEHLIVDGPDVGIWIDEDYSKNSMVVYASQFFDQKLAMYEVSKNGGSVLQSRTIDDTTILDAYMVRIVDLNADGHRQLLVNNHETDDATNGVFSYSFPSNIWTGDWKKTTLASNFQNARSLFVPNMSPGFPYDFYPKVSDADKKHVKPHIVVAGDGDYTAHIMTSTGDLTYDLDTIKNEKGTVGALCWSDLDNNDWSELWVPNYDKSYIEVFRFSEKSQEFLQ